MPLNFARARPLLQSCELPKLFVNELGWEPTHQKLTLSAAGIDYTFTAIAAKRGFIAWLCETPAGGLPDHATRLKLHRKLSETSLEHLVVFVTGDRNRQSWMWVRREQGKPLAARTHEYYRGQPGDSLLQKLQSLFVSLEEEEAGIVVTEVSGKVKAAFDIERVTKAFYRDFDTHRKAFLKFIDGIDDVADREWYASVMLNRLMFVYFIQRKGFLDADTNYLRNRLDRCQTEQGKNKFYTFYRYFLLRLFHEGFGKRRKDRAPDLEKLLGNIPYLNGGLFDLHDLEKPERYGKVIEIPDKAFERVFNYFDRYQWHLDERPLRRDDEINPDVLGYIFEKYVNQKQMGAYYSKEDITDYISKNTVLPFLFDAARAKCKVAFENPGGPTVWDLLRENPDRYIYPAVRHGTEKTLPPEIAVGLDTAKPDLVERRNAWNKPASGDYALRTETWREVVARRQRYEEVRNKLASGEVHEVNDFITLNLDLRQFAQDVITNSEGPDLLRAVWHAIEKVTVLDPTCGSGAFLFAALNILEPIYESCLDRMQSFLADDDKTRPKPPEESIRELIASGESRFLEFKSTARWNIRERRPDKAMEQEIVKAVVSFLNSGGGDLLIGVQDDGSIFGIEADQKLFSADKRNRDTYENWLMTHLLGSYGKEHAANLHVSFAHVGEHDVCRVTALPASSAVYIKENNQDALYVRAGNSKRSLNPREAVAYHQQRFTQLTPPVVMTEAPKSTNPKKYGDFRKVLETVAAHPNLRYFVLKSIILNNLFGVDIMEEAVEICKLRLFLKLAAQVEPDAARDNLGIEPLPDIDFNIRAGNSLVGYATYDEVKRAVTSTLDFDNAMEKIAVKAADVQQTFDKFRQHQTEGDSSVPASDKQELQKRLKALEDELDRYLAGDYGVKVSEKVAYAKWLKSHQPFHWFIQFYGILSRGGFNVVIGNPPYVELAKIRDTYNPKGLSTVSSGNLYGMVSEVAFKILGSSSRLGVIIPMSVVSTARMESVRNLILTTSDVVHLSHYSGNRNPSVLFDGVEMRLTICFAKTKTGAPKSLSLQAFSTEFRRWASTARAHLFATTNYVQVPSRFHSGSLFPKFGSNTEEGILRKALDISGSSTLGIATVSDGVNNVYAHRIASYFVKGLTFVPRFASERDGAKRSEDYKVFSFANKGHASAACCIINSSLFYFYYIVFSDAYHCGRELIEQFPVNISRLSAALSSEMRSLEESLMRDFKKNSDIRKIAYKNTGLVEMQKFFPKLSKPILDRIDTALARHYGFTAEELDFILNYDLKYRMGRDAESEEG